MRQALVEAAKAPSSPLLQVKRVAHALTSIMLFYSCYFTYGLTLTVSFKSGKFVSDLLRHPHFSPKATIKGEFSRAQDLTSRRILRNSFPRLSFICHHDESQEIAVKEARALSKEEKSQEQQEKSDAQQKDLLAGLEKAEKKHLECRDANKISRRRRRPDILTRPSLHLTAVCQRRASRAARRPAPARRAPAARRLREWKISFKRPMTTDFTFHPSRAAPSPPITRWVLPCA